MISQADKSSSSSPIFLCPDLRRRWKLGKLRDSSKYVLQEVEGQRIFSFSDVEGFALRHFTGDTSVERVQRLCVQQFGERVEADFTSLLLAKLERLGVLGQEAVLRQRAGGRGQKRFKAEGERDFKVGDRSGDDVILPANNGVTLPLHKGENPGSEENEKSPSRVSSPLKPEVQWFSHPDGYWILRNQNDLTFLQVNDIGKAVTDDLGQLSPHEIVAKHGISQGELQQHLGLLAATGMLRGTKPASGKKGKFTPLDLLFILVPLFNPDAMLSRHVEKVRWLFSRIFGWGVLGFLLYSSVVGLSQKEALAIFGLKLWQGNGTSLILPFIALSLLVVSLHELAHAFTLKQYGGRVPEMGVMLMCLFPAAYTDTTDAYCLVRRRQRVLVVAAGVLCQLVIAAIAFWLWTVSVPGSGLNVGSYLLLAAALFTVAVNLNPLAKFDGYYLAVAATGINNLRSRSFLFYLKLLMGKPIGERNRDAWVLALFAPLSLMYLWLVFGFLFARIADWILTNAPFLTLTVLAVWAIYYFCPSE